MALNLDRDRDLDPDRKINDLEKEWNMDAQDGQDGQDLDFPSLLP